MKWFYLLFLLMMSAGNSRLFAASPENATPPKTGNNAEKLILEPPLLPINAELTREDLLRRYSVHFVQPGGKPRDIWYEEPDDKGGFRNLPFRTGQPQWVMPVGAGDFSAMVSFGEDELHVHLSKTDFLALNVYGGKDLLSPGHVTVKFANLTMKDISSFDQCMDLLAGSVRITINTPDGVLQCEVSGDHKTNALFIAVEDRRGKRGVTQVSYDNWRADPANYRPSQSFKGNLAEMIGIKVGVQDSLMWTEQLSASTGIGYAVAVGIKNPEQIIARQELNSKVSLETPEARNGLFTIVMTCVGTKGREPLPAAVALLKSVIDEDPSIRRERRLAWWREFWSRSFIDLRGSQDAEFLTRIWLSTLYSYASVGYGPLPPKFNGGAGLVFRDLRPWGKDFWWQNTREMIWPMGTANHIEFAKRYLDFYDACFDTVRTEKIATGINLPETMQLESYPDLGKLQPEKRQRSLSPFAEPDEADCIKFLEYRLAKKGNLKSHIFSSTGELVQQLFDYVQYTGDREFLQRVAAPWLYEAARMYLLLLTLEPDGKYHLRCVNANETYVKIDDAVPELCAVGYCFGMVVKHGQELGYPPEFIAAVKKRFEHLAPLPTADDWSIDSKDGKVLEVRSGDKIYLPADLKPDQKKSNFEDNEMYVVFPFTMDRSEEEGVLRQRAIATDAHRLHGRDGGGGWCPSPIQAARLRLPDACQRIVNHARNSTPWPYGGGTSPGGRLFKGGKGTGAPMFDASGVIMTGIQEALLQSQAPEPSDDLLTGGLIRLLPAISPKWSGSFKLQARGGFDVAAEFAVGKISLLQIVSKRGSPLKLVNPFSAASVTVNGAAPKIFRTAVISIITAKDDRIVVTPVP
ncbi:MAG: DUF5703 domain-containing protein [Victivallales bacterium]|jgi:hypothetical protein